MQKNTPKNECKHNELELIKKAIKDRKWVLIYGGKRKDKQRRAEIAHQFEKQIKHKKNASIKGDSFHKADLAGCPDKEVYKSFLNELRFFKDTDSRLELIHNIAPFAKTLFIENLSCKNEQSIEQITKLSGQLGIFKDANPNIGTLIVGLDSIDSYNKLPKVFKDIFVIILVGKEQISPDFIFQSVGFKPSDNIFCKFGDWLINYEEKLIVLKDEGKNKSKGLYYIAHLLSTPNKDFHVSELKKLTDLRLPSNIKREDIDEGQDNASQKAPAKSGTNVDKIVDKDTIIQIKKR